MVVDGGTGEAHAKRLHGGRIEAIEIVDAERGVQRIGAGDDLLALGLATCLCDHRHCQTTCHVASLDCMSGDRLIHRMTLANKISSDSSDTLLVEVCEVIHQRLGLELDQVRARAAFVELGADSLDVVDIMLTLEKRLQITFQSSDFRSIDRVADLVGVIRAKLAA
ncbi:MAG TPA: phosphopantetheine-binding protein [Kofleriaceae bacterium]